MGKKNGQNATFFSNLFEKVGKWFIISVMEMQKHFSKIKGVYLYEQRRIN